MKQNFASAKSIIATGFLFISGFFFTSVSANAQTPKEPFNSSLLNGMKILIWSEPNNPKVYIKLRIHSGTAFDPVGKTGTMALLGDILFPEEDIKGFFKDELEGELEVKYDYDSITISAFGNASEADRIIGVIQSAILNTPINDENLKRLRDEKLKRLSEANSTTPSVIADNAIFTRLYKQFPYARPINGQAETLAKIDRVDLQFARERFLKADNATITIVGGVNEQKVLRSLRTKLGSWIKSDKIITQAFSQPDAPNAKTLIVDSPNSETAEIRLAVRGFSRSDKDYFSAMILAMVAEERLKNDLSNSSVAVKHNSHFLPGVFLFSANVQTLKASQSLETAKRVLSELATKEPNAAEFEKAKNTLSKTLNQQMSDTKTLADFYLDRDTFRIQMPAKDVLNAVQNLKPNDIQRTAARLLGNVSFASVAVGNVIQLKDELARNGNAIEIFGEKPVPQTTPKPQDDKQKKQGQTLVLKPIGKP